MGNAIFIESITPDQFLESVRLVIKEEIAILQLERTSPKYLTRTEVAEMLRISLPTLWDYTRTGKIKGHRIEGRVLYSEQDIKEALKEIAKIKYARL